MTARENSYYCLHRLIFCFSLMPTWATSWTSRSRRTVLIRRNLSLWMESFGRKLAMVSWSYFINVEQSQKNFWKNNSPFVNLNGLASQWFWLFPVINKIIIFLLVSICRYSKVIFHSMLKLKIIIKNCFAFRVARFKHYVARKIFFRSFAWFVQWLSNTEVNKIAKLYIFRR